MSAFFTLSNQPSATQLPTLLVPSASLSLEIVANYLRLRRASVALIEPCFDNIPLILKRHSIHVAPISEDDLGGDQSKLSRMFEELTQDAVLLVLPNNPTGFMIDQDGFERLARACSTSRKLLILDFSFRFFAPDLTGFDQYEILKRSGCDFIAIEDTGKTWPTLDLKVSAMTAQTGIHEQLACLYHEIFMGPSPLAVVLLRDLIQESLKETPNLVFRALVQRNRDVLRKAVAGTCLVPETQPLMSVEWLRIDDTSLTDQSIVEVLELEGVHVLPGRQFFWSRYGPQPFVRVALLRDSALFSSAVAEMSRAVLKLSKF